jgi:hypothetical protein
MQEVPEKPNHFIARDGLTIGLNVQLDLALRGRHTQGTDQIQAFVVV